MLTLLSAGIHGLALAAVLVNNLYAPEVSGLLALLIVLSCLRSIRSGSVRTLRLRSDRWSVDGGEALRLKAPVFVGRRFVILRFSGRPGYVVIGQNCLPAEEFRKLRVLLSARANRMMAA